MKVDVISMQGSKVRKVDLPAQFSEAVRLDLIKRAVLSIQSHNRQPYGTFPQAGIRQVAKLSRRRRQFKTAYGHGISRVPRKALWNRGRQFGWVGAFAPGTVKGRKANPPKAEKIWKQKINVQERRKAIRSALAATMQQNLIKQRGHLFKELTPVVDAQAESLAKTREVQAFLEKMGLQAELSRVAERRIRAGRGKMRNRPYKQRKGPLFVVSGDCKLLKSARNIPGIDVCEVKKLNAELLAPGCIPGRLTLFTEQALDVLQKEQLFMNVKKEKAIKEEKKKPEAVKSVAKPVVKKAVKKGEQ
ncbi:MAG TPA: 50S ribosomal protein L4 [Candidatus Nanoarchaeia archaeon]|nr:50S ribosomal protein L4 [Candidatus Nanoarchaeia archaeon]